MLALYAWNVRSLNSMMFEKLIVLSIQVTNQTQQVQIVYNVDKELSPMKRAALNVFNVQQELYV